METLNIWEIVSLVASFDKNNRNGDSLKKKQTYVLEKPGEKLLLWLGEKKKGSLQWLRFQLDGKRV